MARVTAGTSGIAGAIGLGWLGFLPADVSDRLEYLPASIASAAVQLAEAQPVQASDRSMQFDFSNETVGAEPKSFLAVVGFGAEGDNKFLVVDGRRWKQGQPAANVADKARAIYGERYAEFLDNVQAYAYFPYAVAQRIDDFRGVRSACGSSRLPDASIREPGSCSISSRTATTFWCGPMPPKTISCCSSMRRASARA